MGIVPVLGEEYCKQGKEKAARTSAVVACFQGILMKARVCVFVRMCIYTQSVP